MIQKRAVMLAVCVVLLLCVFAAGCSGPTASPTPSAANASIKNASAQASASAPAASPSPPTALSPSGTPTPIAPPNPQATVTPASIAATGMPTVYFYYRPDCPYCQALEPQVSALQTQYAGKASVVWIESTGVVPTLVLYNQAGAQVGQWVNPGTTASVAAQIDSLLASG